jgi:hypothetical protein
MAVLDYVEIPPYATLLPREVESSSQPQKATEKMSSKPTQISLPSSSLSQDQPLLSLSQSSPNRSTFGNIPGMLLASTLQLPSNVNLPGNPRNEPPSRLLSTRDALSAPTATVNFRRFISKIGPIFWLQDRVEEVLMWRKGWPLTMMWMISYALICV